MAHKTVDLLKALTEAPGPSGHEGAVRELVEEHWRPWADDLRTDAMGSLIAHQRGNGDEPRPAVMIAAHLDEIGLIVTGIEREFLRVHALGGIDRRMLLGLEVVVHAQRDLPGVIGSRPPHVLHPDEHDKILDWEEIFVDVGLTPDEVEELVEVGDHITISRELAELKGHRLAGKALDNRASVVATTLVLEMLRERAHAWDVYAVATVQEEVGVKGAITSAYGLAPDLAIAMDVTFAKQHDDSKPGTFDLDKGPTIVIGPNFHPQVVKRLQKVAKAAEIPFQTEVAAGVSGTDAWGIQVAREGIPTGLIALPVRYMHQPVETIARRTIERAARILTEFIADLEADFRPAWEDEDENE